jgi:DNA-binding transcriptional LysR family regulator
MELQQIRYFVALSDTLNFARAAERCRVSSPSLTRAIQKLEHELGGVLIRRERKLTHLTDLGRLVQPMLKEILAYAEGTKTAARQFLKTEDDLVKLGVMSSVGARRLAPFLARFGAQHPGVKVSIVAGDATRLAEWLLSENLDAVVAAKLRCANRRLRHYELYRECVVVVFPVGHRFERHETVRLVDLKDEKFLLRANCEKCALILMSCRARGFQPSIVYHCEREDWIQVLVAAGCGVTLMPESMHLGYGTLARPLIEPVLSRDVSLITVAGRPYDSPVLNLVRAIRAHKWDTEPFGVCRHPRAHGSEQRERNRSANA